MNNVKLRSVTHNVATLIKKAMSSQVLIKVDIFSFSDGEMEDQRQIVTCPREKVV